MIDKSVSNKCIYEVENDNFKNMFDVKYLNLINMFTCVDFFGDDETGGLYTNGIWESFYDLCGYMSIKRNIFYDIDNEYISRKHIGKITKLIIDKRLVPVSKYNKYKKKEFDSLKIECEIMSFKVNNMNEIEDESMTMFSTDGKDYENWQNGYKLGNYKKYYNECIEEFRDLYPKMKFLGGSDLISLCFKEN